MKTNPFRYFFLVYLITLFLIVSCSRGTVTRVPTQVDVNTNEPATPPKEFPAGFSATTIPTKKAVPTIQANDPDLALAHLGVPWADFSLEYDPSQWDAMEYRADMPGLVMLSNHSLAGCLVTPYIPAGLGDGWTTEESQKTICGKELQIKRFFEQGELRFVAYYGFLGSFYEGGVEIHFEDDADTCIQAAESLFSNTEVVIP